jgi:hypothetical protein
MGPGQAVRQSAIEAGKSRGPARFFSDHPVLHAVSLSGAGSATVLFALRAARSRGARRLGWSALALLEFAIVVGMGTLERKRARKG